MRNDKGFILVLCNAFVGCDLGVQTSWVDGSNRAVELRTKIAR
jgi:hypothetical protein